MTYVVVDKGNEQTRFSRGLLSFDGLLPRFAVFEDKSAQEADATVHEED